VTEWKLTWAARVQNEEIGTWSTKFAFVTFESTEAAQAAMQDHAVEPIVISRRAVRMTFVYERDNANKPVHPRRLFVAGLPLKATQKEVARAFGLKEENVETIQHQSTCLHFFVFHVNAFADTSVQTIQDPLSFISTLVTMPARFSSKLNATRWC
jgi:hypothetical protein